MNMHTAPAPTGLELIQRERTRQHHDALASLDGNTEMACRVADSAYQTGQVLLLGMGASHHANLVAAAVFRTLGVEAFALPFSEALYAPLPERPRTVLLTSQSGGSIEAERYLQRERPLGTCFGVTLNPDSVLGRSVPSLIAEGGSEQGFAATRSYLLTLALHAAVAEALGANQEDLRAVLQAPPRPDVRVAAGHLQEATHFIWSARGPLQGVAEVGALGVLELARVPAFALEGGQFRHGPLEAVNSNTGVVLLRDAPHAALTDNLRQACREAGTQPVVLDVSGDEAAAVDPFALSVGRHDGFAAAAALCEPLQGLLLALAAARVEHVGEPVRSSKVTRTE